MSAYALMPGDYALEMELGRPLHRDVLDGVLRAAGFSDLAYDAGFQGGKRLRVVARLPPSQDARGAVLSDVPGACRWTMARRLEVDPFAPATLSAEPLRLRHGTHYCARMCSADSALATREAVWDRLRKTGYDPKTICEIKRNLLLLPGQSGQPSRSYSQWVAYLFWPHEDATVYQHPSLSVDQLRFAEPLDGSTVYSPQSTARGGET